MCWASWNLFLYARFELINCKVTTDLAGVVQCDSIDASHHYFRGVFVHGALAVSHIGDILNYHLKKTHTENEYV